MAIQAAMARLRKQRRISGREKTQNWLDELPTKDTFLPAPAGANDESSAPKPSLAIITAAVIAYLVFFFEINPAQVIFVVMLTLFLLALGWGSRGEGGRS